MNFHAPTGRFVVTAEDIKKQAMSLLYALRKVREASKLPLDRYEHKPPLRDCDHAQIAIIQAAEDIGIDLGVPHIRFNELDLRDAPR